MAIASALLLTAMHSADAPAKSPNIMFIFADDYGIPGVGCGGGALKTPNLDAIAASGVTDTNRKKADCDTQQTTERRKTKKETASK